MRWGSKDWDEVRRAAEAGDSEAQHYLGTCLANGDRIAADPTEARNWFLKASDAGFMPSTANLGVLRLRGLGVAKDQNEAQRLFRIAAEGGVAQAQYNLGWMLLETPGTNAAEGLIWYRRAADQGHLQAMVALGRCFRSGTGASKDLEEAVRWFERAAALEDPEGLVNLAWVYGYESSDHQDQAVALYRRAADKGQRDAMYELFLCFRDGNGVPEDSASAREWLRKSAEAGLPLGQTVLGDWLETREPAAMPEAVQWYRRAVDQGWSGAWYRLGLCYLNGQGVELDEERALELIRTAADQGQPYALFKLAELYGRGIGEPRGEQDGPVLLLRRSVANGHPWAQRVLKERYHDIGTTR